MTSKAPLTLGAITFRDRPFHDVLRAASTAGFEAIGVTVGQCISALERGVELDSMLPEIRSAGLRVGEFELIRLAGGGHTDRLNGLAVELVPLLLPDRVHTAAFTGERSAIQAEFEALCHSLSGVDVAIEFMPYSAIPRLEDAVEMVRASGAPNARIVLDVLHFYRSGGALSDLTPEVLRYVACVQLSDVVRRPAASLAHEARHQRTFPGEGALDVVGFLSHIESACEVMPPISVEPISDALEQMPLDWVADQAMVATQRVLAAAHGLAGTLSLGEIDQ